MLKDNPGLHIAKLYKKASGMIPYEKQVELAIDAAEIFISIGQIKKSEETLRKIIGTDKFSKIPNNLKYRLFSKLFKIYYKSGDYVKAEEILNDLLQISKEYEDENLLCSVFLKYGNIYVRKREYEKAKEFYTKAVEIGEQQESRKKCLASAYNNIAVYYAMVNKDYDRALIYFQKALSLYETESNNLGVTVRILLNLGNLFKTKKYYEKAQDYYQRVHSIAIEHNFPEILANVYHEKAEIYFEIGEHELSEIFVKKALELHRKLNGREGNYRSGQAFELLAKIKDKAGENFEKIKEYSQEAVGYYTRSEAWEDAVRMYDFLGDVAYKRGQFLIAKELYENGLLLSQRKGIEQFKQKFQEKIKLV